MRDMLLFGGSDSDKYIELLEWATKTRLHEFVPDMHRLQIERWIWDRRHALFGRVLDVGADVPRRWLGDGYKTFGLYDCDVIGNLLDMPFADETFDGVLLTEVLEHCEDPFRAVKEVWRTMKKAGLLLVSAPFIWPWHGTDHYPDFWRFTDDAWRLLLKDFASVKVWAADWTTEGEQLYDMLRRFECMGMRNETRACTGYLVEAFK